MEKYHDIKMKSYVKKIRAQQNVFSRQHQILLFQLKKFIDVWCLSKNKGIGGL
jgi:hypothetical protein